MELSLSSLKEFVLKKIQKPHLLGVDLGSCYTKIVSWDRRTANKTERFFYPEPISLENPSSLQNFRAFLKENGMLGMPVACAIDDPSLKIRRTDLPKMPEFDLKEAVKWQLRNVTEDSLDLYLVRYSVLDQYTASEGERLSLQIFAIHREAIRKRVMLLRKLSLKPVLIEPAPVALLSTLDRTVSWKPNETYGVLDLGERSTNFLAVEQGKLFFSRPLVQVSGKDFLNSLVQELAIPEAQALPRYRKILQEPSLEIDERSQTLLLSYYSKIAIETQRALDAFSLLFKDKKVNSLLLCGGGAAFPGLRDYLAKNLGGSASLIDPFAGLDAQGRDNHLYAIASGLVFHEL